MPRFSVAFAKRKSTADDLEHVDVIPAPQSSFRVLERNDYSSGKSFDGGARMARASNALLPKPDFHVEDNMFADLKANDRGSGLSNTTHATSTDNSSRHSNASTAPSSADFGGGNAVQDENRHVSKASSPEMPGRGPSNRSMGSKFLDRAGRTFSFGGQKKHTIPPPREDPKPDLPPMLTLGVVPGSRGMTASASNTETPSEAEPEKEAIDLGGDFGSMFTKFDKRASMATLRNDDMASPRILTGNRQGHSQPRPGSPDITTPADPLLSSWNTPKSSADLPASSPGSPTPDRPPPVPLHQSPSRFKPSTLPLKVKEDEEARLLQETYTAIKLLSTSDSYPDSNSQPGRYRREEESFTVVPRNKLTAIFNNNNDNDNSNIDNNNNGSKKEEDNLFEGKMSRFAGPAHRHVASETAPPRNKVMTPAEFEKYRADKIRQGSGANVDKAVAKGDDDDEEINYDDDEDEAEKSKQQAKQRRKQEAHMAVYRQQMMKVTGETANPSLPLPNRTGLPSSMSAPQLSQMQASLPTAPAGPSDEEDDEEIPLAILQAHGFPAKNRPPTRLSTMGSNPNLRASVQFLAGRPPSAMGDAAAPRRHSHLPAFARNLPQDPFFGAGIAKPALRESLSFNDASHGPKPPSPLPPGGLVGVIANEERSRAMRRGSPSVDASRLMGGGFNGGHGPNGPGMDPVGGIPPHIMYSQSQMPGMPPMMPHMMHQMTQPVLTPGDQAQIQMTQQMSQFMQMQMQFMQMMAVSQNGGMPQQQQQQQQPYGGLPSNQPMADMASRHSMMHESAMEPRRPDWNMRTMSMVQPSSAPMVRQPEYAGSVRSSIGGYQASIAPSERSNIGLPNRYRPVSQVAASTTTGQHLRSGSLPGALSALGDTKANASMRAVNKSTSESDDDEQGWEAMKTKREKKRSLWKTKKGLSG